MVRSNKEAKQLALQDIRESGQQPLVHRQRDILFNANSNITVSLEDVDFNKPKVDAYVSKWLIMEEHPICRETLAPKHL